MSGSGVKELETRCERDPETMKTILEIVRAATDDLTLSTNR